MNSNEESKNSAILTEEQKNALLSVLMNACRNRPCDDSHESSNPDPSDAIDTEFDSDEESTESSDSVADELSALLKLLDAHDKVCRATLSFIERKK